MSNERKLSIDEMLALEGQKKLDGIMVNIILVLLLCVPLITRVAVTEHISPLISGNNLDTGMKAEVFTYFKFIFLFSGVILLIGLFLYKMLGKNYFITRSYINVPLGVMFLVVLLSAVFADHKIISFFGQYNRHEGVLTYLLYFSLFFIAANITYTFKKLDGIFYCLYGVATVNALLVLLHFYGYDVLSSTFLKSLVLPSIDEGAIQQGSSLSSTINNPNYVSGFSSVLVSFFITRALLDENRKHQLLNLTFSVVSFAMLLASLSTSGFVTLLFVFVLVVIFLLFSKRRKSGFMFLGINLVCFVLVFMLLNSHDPRVAEETIGFFLSSQADQSIQKDEVSEIKEILATISPFASKHVYADEQLDEFNLPPQGYGPGTGRLYIWQKVMDLIYERPFLGYGMDTLPYYFPQDDPAKHSNINDYNVIVDKPHNIYIGYAFGAGIFMLLAFIWLIIQHIWNNIKALRKGITEKYGVFVASLFAAWCAYLAQGMFNDSIIGTAPVFWILFGVSVSVLREGITE